MLLPSMACTCCLASSTSVPVNWCRVPVTCILRVHATQKLRVSSPPAVANQSHTSHLPCPALPAWPLLKAGVQASALEVGPQSMSDSYSHLQVAPALLCVTQQRVSPLGGALL